MFLVVALIGAVLTGLWARATTDAATDERRPHRAHQSAG
jgi:hypothetical protein